MIGVSKAKNQKIYIRFTFLETRTGVISSLGGGDLVLGCLRILSDKAKRAIIFKSTKTTHG
jgi:hypothetical protein